MKTKLFIISLLLLALAGASTVWAAQPPSVQVTVTALTSTPGGVVPAPPGNSGNDNQWFYEYTIAPDSLTDTLPIQICTKSTPTYDKDGNLVATGYPLVLKFGPVGNGGNLPGVTLPAIPKFDADGCQTANIDIAATELAAGSTYNKVVEVQVDSSTPDNTQVNIDGRGIHVHVIVTSGQPTVTCFVTDSSFNYLLDCSGGQVTFGNGGRFAIVANNKKVEVATNPGQFYYNIIWTNTTGVSQTVSVTFARSSVNPHGAQAIHALVFPSFPSLDATAFALVNDGIPSGADDKLESVVVPAGDTLWVDYHLEWSGLGSPLPLGIGTSCSTANQSFSVTGTVKTSDGVTTFGGCTAGATGYKK